jgi:GMP synthase-like glutamine amidotransferase
VKPVLVADCYVEGDGSVNFRRLLGDHPVSVWRPCDSPTEPDLSKYRAMMISGSAACVTDPVEWMQPLVSVIQQSKKQGLPVLGICFGHQIVAHALFGDGSVRKAATPEIGWKRIQVNTAGDLLDGLGTEFTTFESHFDEVRDGIHGMTVFARSADCAVQAYRVDGAKIWGIQFHAEMQQSEAEVLAGIRIGGRPDLGLDLELTLAQSRDSTPLGLSIFNNFLSLA